MRKLIVLVIALLVAGSLAASATVLTGFGSIPTAALIPIPSNVLAYGGGPITWGNDTWTSTNLYNGGGAVFGNPGSYGFGATNGYWDSNIGPMIGLNDSTSDYGATDTMTIAFTNPVFAVGDFFNYDADAGESTPTTIAVYDTSGNLIESYTLNFSTGGATDSGEWLGFSETTPIGSLVLTDNYIAMSSTPEPSSLLLLGSGLLGLAGVARRKLGRKAAITQTA
ncbi:MAG: PEP-CTERM sorting domain-containing protein [Terracidiphilus sp.]